MAFSNSVSSFSLSFFCKSNMLLSNFFCVSEEPSEVVVRELLQGKADCNEGRQLLAAGPPLLPDSGPLMLDDASPLLAETLGARPNMYLPSIPNLPYQVGLEGPPLNATTWMNPKTCRPPRAASRTL